MAKWIGIMALAIHLALAAVCFLTMDHDMHGGIGRKVLDRVIDTYEFVGFGEMALGILGITLVLTGLAWWLWKGSGQRRPVRS